MYWIESFSGFNLWVRCLAPPNTQFVHSTLLYDRQYTVWTLLCSIQRKPPLCPWNRLNIFMHAYNRYFFDCKSVIRFYKYSLKLALAILCNYMDSLRWVLVGVTSWLLLMLATLILVWCSLAFSFSFETYFLTWSRKSDLWFRIGWVFLFIQVSSIKNIKLKSCEITGCRWRPSQ